MIGTGLLLPSFKSCSELAPISWVIVSIRAAIRNRGVQSKPTSLDPQTLPTADPLQYFCSALILNPAWTQIQTLFYPFFFCLWYFAVP